MSRGRSSQRTSTVIVQISEPLEPLGLLLGLLNIKPEAGFAEKDLIAWAELRTAAVARLNFDSLIVSKNPRSVRAAVVMKAELATFFVEPDMCVFTRDGLFNVASTFLENHVIPPNDPVMIVNDLSQATEINS